jgi:hypothetical protein
VNEGVREMSEREGERRKKGEKERGRERESEIHQKYKNMFFWSPLATTPLIFIIK